MGNDTETALNRVPPLPIRNRFELMVVGFYFYEGAVGKAVQK